MKKILSYGLLLMIVLFSACRKADNPKIPVLERVPVPSLSVVSGSSNVIIPSDIANYVGKVNVDLFFKSDIPPQKMDLVIFRNHDTTGQKILQAGITTFPSVITFTGPQLVTLFGTVQTCDFFTIGVNITTKSGTLYEAFPKPVYLNGTATSIVPYGSGVAGQFGGVVTSLKYKTKVEYDPAIYQGNFVVVQDDWADTNPGDPITLTKIDDTHFSFKYLSPGTPTLINAVPIIVTVDPTTNTPSIAKQTVGTGWTYDKSQPVTVRTTPSASNSLSPCSGGLSLNLSWSQGTGEYGNIILSLKKK
jgi:hypothetical protein